MRGFETTCRGLATEAHNRQQSNAPYQTIHVPIRYNDVIASFSFLSMSFIAHGHVTFRSSRGNCLKDASSTFARQRNHNFLA